MDGRGFSVDVEHSHPVAVVRARGVFDAYAAPDLRAALLDALGHQPTGVLVDLADMTVEDDVALTVLAAAARESERWPGAPFVVAGAAATVGQLDIDRYVVFCPDVSAALLELGRQPVPPWRQDPIVPDRDAPAAARRAVREFCAAQAIGGAGDAAQLVASELVTNAVVHAGTPIDLTLRLVGPALHIGVRDASPEPPRIASFVDESSESGRGLLLVDAMSSTWGSLFLHGGKVVWAAVPVRPPAAAGHKASDLGEQATA